MQTSVIMFTAAFENLSCQVSLIPKYSHALPTHQTANRFKHVPSIDLSQKCRIGQQANKAEKKAQNVHPTMKPIKVKQPMRNFRSGKMRRYWSKIDSLAKQSAT